MVENRILRRVSPNDPAISHDPKPVPPSPDGCATNTARSRVEPPSRPRLLGRLISDWSQIPGHFRSSVSPSLLAAFRRFVTHTIRAYQAVQLAEIRPRLVLGQFVSHNFHVSFHSGDNTIIARDLDQVLFDYYPNCVTTPTIPAGGSPSPAAETGKFLAHRDPGRRVKYIPVNAALARGVTRALNS